MAGVSEILYIGHNNIMTTTFLQNNSAMNITGIKAQLEIYYTRSSILYSFNTVDNASLFDTSDAANGKLTFKPVASTFANATAGSYTARYTLYPTGYPDGLVFPEFTIILKEA